MTWIDWGVLLGKVVIVFAGLSRQRPEYTAR